MIGQLTGVLIEKQPPQLVLNVQGVGYEIDAPMSTFYLLPDLNHSTTLYTHLIVREDAHLLYGFLSRDERLLFRTLLKVNGVGPRLALTILSSLEIGEFVSCVVNNDSASLVRVPGIGKKTAERLIIEMRDRLTHLQSDNVNPDALSLPKTVTNPRNQVVQDAVSALIALGYKPQEASRAVSKVNEGRESSEEIIRYALKEMM